MRGPALPGHERTRPQRRYRWTEGQFRRIRGAQLTPALSASSPGDSPAVRSAHRRTQPAGTSSRSVLVRDRPASPAPAARARRPRRFSRAARTARRGPATAGRAPWRAASRPRRAVAASRQSAQKRARSPPGRPRTPSGCAKHYPATSSLHCAVLARESERPRSLTAGAALRPSPGKPLAAGASGAWEESHGSGAAPRTHRARAECGAVHLRSPGGTASVPGLPAALCTCSRLRLHRSDFVRRRLRVRARPPHRANAHALPRQPRTLGREPRAPDLTAFPPPLPIGF
jgi:hypothetical protein